MHSRKAVIGVLFAVTLVGCSKPEKHHYQVVTFMRQGEVTALLVDSETGRTWVWTPATMNYPDMWFPLRPLDPYRQPEKSLTPPPIP